MKNQGPKFVVFKVDDINKYVSDEGKLYLSGIAMEIEEGRRKDNKKLNKYIVVNMDEPYSLIVSELVNLGNVQKEYQKEKLKDEN